ncbi:hypothetical protein ACFE04_001460 [Oxalis oulophora]
MTGCNRWSRLAYEMNLEVGDLIELYYIDQDHGGEGGEERMFQIMVTNLSVLPGFSVNLSAIIHLTSSIDTVVVDPRKLHMEVVDENEIWQLGNEWSRFVNEKNLEVGDLIEIYSIEQDHGGGGDERRFKIMVTKPISITRLFSETIGYFSPQ